MTPIQVVIGHFVMGKNKNPENVTVMLELLLLYLSGTMGHSMSPRMRVAMEKLFNTTFVPTAREKFASMDSRIKGATSNGVSDGDKEMEYVKRARETLNEFNL